MPNRLEKIISLAVETDEIKLKVCPRCESAYSKYDVYCQRCTQKAKKLERILEVHNIKAKLDKKEPVTDRERKLYERSENLLLNEITPEGFAFLEETPFELSEETVAVRPTFKNRLQFFLDRMQEIGKKVTTTYAATKLLKFDSKDDFVNFATDNGVRPLMSADWNQHYAAWKVEDIIRLFGERTAKKSVETVTEVKPTNMMNSAEAASALGIPGPKVFVDFAISNGIKPVKEFGEKPEQKIWHAENVMALRRIWELEKDIKQLEEAEKRIEQAIEDLQKLPMKWPQIQDFRKKQEDLVVVRNSLTKVRQQRAQETAKLQDLAKKSTKTSNMRFARIIALASKN